MFPPSPFETHMHNHCSCFSWFPRPQISMLIESSLAQWFPLVSLSTLKFGVRGQTSEHTQIVEFHTKKKNIISVCPRAIWKFGVRGHSRGTSKVLMALNIRFIIPGCPRPTFRFRVQRKNMEHKLNSSWPQQSDRVLSIRPGPTIHFWARCKSRSIWQMNHCDQQIYFFLSPRPWPTLRLQIRKILGPIKMLNLLEDDRKWFCNIVRRTRTFYLLPFLVQFSFSLNFQQNQLKNTASASKIWNTENMLMGIDSNFIISGCPIPAMKFWIVGLGTSIGRLNK